MGGARTALCVACLALALCCAGEADDGVCPAENARADCGVTLVVQQPGRSLLPFVADEVRAHVCVRLVCLCVYP